MLMVLFGAGASYDSAPSYPPRSSRLPGRDEERRPPLANELFENRDVFATGVSNLPKCKPINIRLRNIPEDTSIEQELQKIQAEAEGDPERHRQLAAVRFYLQYIIFQCQRGWKNRAVKDGSNYDALLDQLRHWSKGREKICLVTFNYDTMLEEALPAVDIRIEGLRDYIARDNYKIIKLHGSVNWTRQVNTVIHSLDNRDEWNVASELIDRATEIDITDTYLFDKDCPIAKSKGVPVFPAVAIPLETKSYECPRDHIETLEECIPEVTRVLVIGWRATEYHFLQLLAQKHRPPLRVMIVSGSPESAREVGDRLKEAGVTGTFFLATGGFTNFVLSGEATEFLQT